MDILWVTLFGVFYLVLFLLALGCDRLMPRR